VSGRFEYEQTYDFAEVQRLAALGWRLAGLAVVPGASAGSGTPVYVLERPVAGSGMGGGLG
jgi:hypothetical protein